TIAPDEKGGGLRDGGSSQGPNAPLRGFAGSFLVLVLSCLLGARSDKWVRLAQHDLIFAKELSSDGVRFGPKFMDEVIVGRVLAFGCNPRPSRLAGLDPVLTRQVHLYSDHHCNPWSELWANELWPCEGRSAPRWCKSEDPQIIVSHLKVGPYYETLTTAITTTDDGLVRSNIMAVIVDRLRDKMLRDYPREAIDGWLGSATSAFLERARIEDALAIGWMIRLGQLGDNPSVSASFQTYLNRVQNVKAEEKNLLNEVTQALGGQSMSAEAKSQLVMRFGPNPAQQSSPSPPDRTDMADIALLVNRVGAYYGVINRREFDKAWDLAWLDYREEVDRDSYVRTMESIWHRRRFVTYILQDISIHGDTARVTAEVHQQTDKVWSRNQELVRQDIEFWIFEKGNWFNMVKWPDWKDSQAVPVPIP
ncbi:MAG TPA: hypothetical protein VFW45_10925, partial [Candidatus Polarisedimenticolia bacterium]|nr:hypothetical protein [Candidatus Polarisedimenticolia bacterium]